MARGRRRRVDGVRVALHAGAHCSPPLDAGVCRARRAPRAPMQPCVDHCVPRWPIFPPPEISGSSTVEDGLQPRIKRATRAHWLNRLLLSPAIVAHEPNTRQSLLRAGHSTRKKKEKKKRKGSYFCLATQLPTDMAGRQEPGWTFAAVEGVASPLESKDTQALLHKW